LRIKITASQLKRTLIFHAALVAPFLTYTAVLIPGMWRADWEKTGFFIGLITCVMMFMFINMLAAPATAGFFFAHCTPPRLARATTKRDITLCLCSALLLGAAVYLLLDLWPTDPYAPPNPRHLADGILALPRQLIAEACLGALAAKLCIFFAIIAGFMKRDTSPNKAPEDIVANAPNPQH